MYNFILNFQINCRKFPQTPTSIQGSSGIRLSLFYFFQLRNI